MDEQVIDRKLQNMLLYPKVSPNEDLPGQIEKACNALDELSDSDLSIISAAGSEDNHGKQPAPPKPGIVVHDFRL